MQIIAFDKGVPLVNAQILSNLCEYHYKSYIAKNRLFGLHFCQSTTFKHSDVIGPQKATKFSRISVHIVVQTIYCGISYCTIAILYNI